MEVDRFDRLTDARRAELEGDEEDPWGSRQLAVELLWRDKDQHVAIAGPEGRLIASAGVVLAEVLVADGPPISVVGIGGVIVEAGHRGHGLGKRVIEEVIRLAETLGPDLAILFCHRDRAGLYRRHGFIEVTDPVLVDQPTGPVRMPMVAMWRALREGASLPPGGIRLMGLPF